MHIGETFQTATRCTGVSTGSQTVGWTGRFAEYSVLWFLAAGSLYGCPDLLVPCGTALAVPNRFASRCLYRSSPLDGWQRLSHPALRCCRWLVRGLRPWVSA